MRWPAIALLLAGAGTFVFLVERARRVRVAAGFDEELAPPFLRVVTIVIVALFFALQGSRWAPPRSLAVALGLASMASSQVVTWFTSWKRGAPFTAAAMESGGTLAVLAAAFGASLLG